MTWTLQANTVAELVELQHEVEQQILVSHLVASGYRHRDEERDVGNDTSGPHRPPV
jgi:hypothetical protein